MIVVTLRYAAVHEDGVPLRFHHIAGFVEGHLQVSEVFSKGKRLDHWDISAVIRPHHEWVGTLRHFGGGWLPCGDRLWVF